MESKGGIKGGILKCIFLFIYTKLQCLSSPAFAPKAYKWTSTEVFFMPKIQKLPTFLG